MQGALEGSLRQACQDASKLSRALCICLRRHFRCAPSAARVTAICDEFESHIPTIEGSFEHHLKIDGGGHRQQYSTSRVASSALTKGLPRREGRRLPRRPPLKSLEYDAIPAIIEYQGSGSMMSMQPAQVSDYSRSG